MKKLLILLMFSFLLVFPFGVDVFIKANPRIIIVPEDYRTIQAAINAANPQDTILVRNGTYCENIVVNKTLSLVGENKTTTIIDGNFTGTTINIVANNVNITGFTIQNSGSYPYACGVYINNFGRNNIRNNIIKNNPLGIIVNSSFNNIVSDNIMANNYGIVVFSSFNNSLSANNIIVTHYGIWLFTSGNNSVYANNITSNTTTHYKGLGIYLYDSSNNSVYANNITKCSYGIWLEYSSNNSVYANNITRNNESGIGLDTSPSNNIVGNNVTNNEEGITIAHSSRNVLRNNSMEENNYNFGVWSWSISVFVNDVDSSNTVDGKPIYYWINKQDLVVPIDAGFVALVNCTNITVQNLNLRNSQEGLVLAYTTNSTVTINNITNNADGIMFYYSDYNRISRNNITNNNNGVYMGYSSSNLFFHNNFVDNFWQQVDFFSIEPEPASFANIWDNSYPSGGNYWSDYIGVDERSGPSQDHLGSDGLGDTPYVVSENNRDNYPLMKPHTDGLRLKPRATFLATPTTVVEDTEEVKFDTSNSYDPDGRVVSYWYDYGDGFNSGWVSESVHHRSYPEPGEYYAKAKVKDDDGLESDWSNSVKITVTLRPSEKIQTTLTLEIPPVRVLAYHTVVFKGQLVQEDEGSGISDALIKLYEKDLLGEEFLAEGRTDQQGKFTISWLAASLDFDFPIYLDRTIEVQAKFEGSSEFAPSASDIHEITIESIDVVTDRGGQGLDEADGSYIRTDVVKLIVSRLDFDVNYPSPLRQYLIRVFDPSGEKVFSRTLDGDDEFSMDGWVGIETDFPLTQEMPLGTYAVEAEYVLVASAGWKPPKGSIYQIGKDVTSFTVIERFEVDVDGEKFTIDLATNSEIVSVQPLVDSTRTILKLSGDDETNGWLNVTVNKWMVTSLGGNKDTIRVLIDGSSSNYTINEIDENYVITVNYSHSIRVIEIFYKTASSFPTTLVVIALIVGVVALSFTAYFLRRKRLEHSSTS